MDVADRSYTLQYFLLQKAASVYIIFFKVDDNTVMEF